MSISSYIDHTILKPEAAPADIRRLCEEAVAYRFAGVCVNSSFVALAREVLAGRGPKVVCVTGFPLGAMSSAAKVAETALAVKSGAEEIDTVIAVGRLLAGEDEYVLEDLRLVVEAAEGRPVKVIIETGLLTDDYKIRACHIALQAGAAFVKTCTGFAKGSATVEDVKLMVRAVAGQCQVKASGGIRDYAVAESLIAAGAARLGTSSGIAIVEGKTVDGGY